MRKTLHPLLREGLDYDGLDLDPEDLLEPYPDSYTDPAYRAAKRRRVEIIATACIKGRLPIIATARLRGPFNNGWKNPWAPTCVEPAYGPSVGEQPTVNQPSEIVQNGSSNELGHANTSVKRIDVKVTIAQASMKARSTNLGVKVISRGKKRNTKGTKSKRRIETPSTSVLSESNEFSVVTEDHSANGGTEALPDDSTNGMRWLRRCPSDDTQDATDLNPLPTPSRRQRRTNGVSKVIQAGLSRPLPMTDSHTNPSPGCMSARPLDHHWHSSNSASMVISSPAGPTSPLPKSARKAEIVPLRTVNRDKTIAKATELSIPPPETLSASELGPVGIGSPLPQSRILDQMTDIRAAQNLAESIVDNVPSSESKPVTREEIRRSAERCAPIRPIASTTTSQSNSVREGYSASTAAELLKPSFSTSFIYRRIGDSKSIDQVPLKSKPRPMTFNSSPEVRANANNQVTKPEGIEDHRVYIEPGDQYTSNSPRPDPYEVVEESRGVREESRSSRHSIQSTQTALMLAQMDFQNSTMHSLASNDQPSWSNDQMEHSPTLYREDRVAITPFRDFNAELDRRNPTESAFRAPPMSTQDLFAAASPFALSTAKKKTVPAKRSSLRFAVLSNETREMRADTETGKKSPTPSAERIPLKERNSYISFKAVADGPQKRSQNSPLGSPVRAKQSLELLQLDLRTSLDDELNFTERFLDHLDGLG
ncbi:hypothetical protein K491DRAFT_715317 [Lophiostoma macrostomum CBS 122681]|uniref:Uncharacterized protein n=1 Tax=Lophiostoma macrostomum CBS 122681 TaxID=1314788 RepID=A0A6A6TD44_9PLEO|nr:hypothetical protein K491DRAFT_715317 [Lophiostoma macrostomum CBS 122681]